MNKAHLVAEVAKVVGSKRKAEDAISCVFETITKALKKGQPLTLVGFGTFRVSKRKARVGRNPQTGKELMKVRRPGNCHSDITDSILDNQIPTDDPRDELAERGV